MYTFRTQPKDAQSPKEVQARQLQYSLPTLKFCDPTNIISRGVERSEWRLTLWLLFRKLTLTTPAQWSNLMGFIIFLLPPEHSIDYIVFNISFVVKGCSRGCPVWVAWFCQFQFSQISFHPLLDKKSFVVDVEKKRTTRKGKKTYRGLGHLRKSSGALLSQDQL